MSICKSLLITLIVISTLYLLNLYVSSSVNPKLNLKYKSEMVEPIREYCCDYYIINRDKITPYELQHIQYPCIFKPNYCDGFASLSCSFYDWQSPINLPCLACIVSACWCLVRLDIMASVGGHRRLPLREPINHHSIDAPSAQQLRPLKSVSSDDALENVRPVFGIATQLLASRSKREGSCHFLDLIFPNTSGVASLVI